jgi:sRNA-binding carbon storage regulator CsrA
MKRSYSLDKMSLKHVRIGLDAPWKMKVQRGEFKEEDQNVWQKKWMNGMIFGGGYNIS